MSRAAGNGSRPPSRDRAAELDEADPLGGFRARFVVPDEKLIYLNGNSLGRLPRATVARLEQVLHREWAAQLVSSFETGWAALPFQVGDLIGTELLGAREGEVAVADSTSVNLFKLASAALDARPGRSVVVTDRDNFPTDRYVLEGLVAARGGSVRYIDGDPVEGPCVDDVAGAIDDDVALISLSHVGYRSGAIADLAGIAAIAHRAGALVLFDLCHSVGALEIDLEAWNVDLAVGCTYKYLCAGPGAPAFLYVREDLQDDLRQPIWGWWGRREMLEMGQGYEPAGGIVSCLSGTPGILALACVEEGARLVSEAGAGPLRRKGLGLTGFAIEVFDQFLAPRRCRLGSPRSADRRGSHVTVCHEDARRLVGQLAELGVAVDFRTPDAIRLGLAPLTTSFVDVWDGMAALASLVDG